MLNCDISLLVVHPENINNAAETKAILKNFVIVFFKVGDNKVLIIVLFDTYHCMI